MDALDGFESLLSNGIGCSYCYCDERNDFFIFCRKFRYFLQMIGFSTSRSESNYTMDSNIIFIQNKCNGTCSKWFYCGFDIKFICSVVTKKGEKHNFCRFQANISFLRCAVLWWFVCWKLLVLCILCCFGIIDHFFVWLFVILTSVFWKQCFSTSQRKRT